MRLVGSIDAVVRTRLLTVGVDALLTEAAALLSQSQLSLVVVCDSRGSVAGVITETLLIGQLGLGRTSLFTTRVGDVISREFTSCSPADSLSRVLATMHEGGLVHVPVVDADNTPVGVVYARDGLRALLAAGNFEEAQLRNYVTGVGYR